MRYQPESASGTIGMISARPSVLSANPVRMILAGRRPPDLRPARIATANMVSESGASDRPVSRASYSSLICRKIGSAIIAPPSVMFCSICPVIPSLKCGSANSSGSSSVTLPSRWRRTSQRASAHSASAPIAISSTT